MLKQQSFHTCRYHGSDSSLLCNLFSPVIRWVQHTELAIIYSPFERVEEMSVNDCQEPGCSERCIDQLPALEIALFFSLYLITSQRDTLISGPGKTHFKVMILLCIKKLFCIIYYLFTEALRALEFHPCMQKRYNPVPRNLLAKTFAITKLASDLLNRFLN